MLGCIARPSAPRRIIGASSSHFRGAAVAGRSLRAQQRGRVSADRRADGLLESDPDAQSEVAVFRDALAKLGWTEDMISGSNFAGAPVMRIDQDVCKRAGRLCGPT